MEKTEGKTITLFINGEPLVALNECNISCNIGKPEILCEAVPEFNLTFDRVEPFELTRKQKIINEWHYAKNLPRKQKKQYRKNLTKAYVYELKREYTHQFLSSI